MNKKLGNSEVNRIKVLTFSLFFASFFAHLKGFITLLSYYLYHQQFLSIMNISSLSSSSSFVIITQPKHPILIITLNKNHLLINLNSVSIWFFSYCTFHLNWPIARWRVKKQFEDLAKVFFTFSFLLLKNSIQSQWLKHTLSKQFIIIVFINSHKTIHRINDMLPKYFG